MCVYVDCAATYVHVSLNEYICARVQTSLKNRSVMNACVCVCVFVTWMLRRRGHMVGVAADDPFPQLLRKRAGPCSGRTFPWSLIRRRRRRRREEEAGGGGGGRIGI